MATAQASADDVTLIIPTELDDSTIVKFLNQAADEIIDEKNIEVSGSKRERLEAYYAALKIVKFRERRAEKESGDETSVTYDSSITDELEAEVRKLDPTDSLITTNKPSASISVPDSKGID